MLYTSYIAKLNKLPKDIPKFLICRYLPRSLDMTKYENVYHKPKLAPSAELLKRYKEDSNWDSLTTDYKYEMEHRLDLYLFLKDLTEYLKTGHDLILVCYEKDREKCHRSILSDYFLLHGVEYMEI